MFAELDILRAQARNFQHQLENHRSILSSSVTNLEGSLQTLRDTSHSNHALAMQAIDGCQDAHSTLRNDFDSVRTLVQDFIDNTRTRDGGTCPLTTPPPTVEEAFAAADAALQEGISAISSELGEHLDRNINSHISPRTCDLGEYLDCNIGVHPTSMTPTVRFPHAADRWSTQAPYDSNAAYAMSHPPGDTSYTSTPSDTGDSTRTQRMGYGGGGNSGGGSPNSYGDGLFPRNNGPNSPRHHNALMRGLHPDILLWHAGGTLGDPVCGCDFMEAEDVEKLDITPEYSVEIAEDHFSSLTTGIILVGSKRIHATSREHLVAMPPHPQEAHKFPIF